MDLTLGFPELHALCFEKMLDEDWCELFVETSKQAAEAESIDEAEMLVTLEIERCGCPTLSIAYLARTVRISVQEEMLKHAICAGEVLDVLRMEDALGRQITQKEARQLAGAFALVSSDVPCHSLEAKALSRIARRFPGDPSLRQRLLSKVTSLGELATA